MSNYIKIRQLRRTLIAAAVGGSLFAGTGSAGTIVGSAHDFTTKGWSDGKICIACHTPHNADTSVTDAPLWNHELSDLSYDMYTSPTFQGQATVDQPDGSSKLCLSCHDGSVAVDAYGGDPGTQPIAAWARIGEGGDLSKDHPISFIYDTNLSIEDGSLFDPATHTVTVGELDKAKTDTIQKVLLFNDKLQCASCHDVHNTFTQKSTLGDSNFLLRITPDGSEICLSCHDK